MSQLSQATLATWSNSQNALLAKALRVVKIDFSPSHRQPAPTRIALATVLALATSLAADALLVVVGTAMFRSTEGYGHFQFADYAKLTTIGVLIASAAWPVVTWISSAPRWLFLRSAVLVTLVLFVPDLYLLYLGQPSKAVAVLIVMHIAIALVTYNALVHVAPVRPGRFEAVD